jgi:L,D-transpeptidase ErfK/SrfK
MKSKNFWFAAALGLSVCSGALQAATFSLPQGNDTLVGKEEHITAGREDTLIDIGRVHGFGYDEISAANPGVDPWMPQPNTTVILPHIHILPDAPRQGIVVNTAEMRLYYYPKATNTVETYPISIGRTDWNTPIVTTKIVRKMANPAWYPPASIRREHLEKGDPLPAMVPPGPDNPLGKYALYLGINGYLMHGTNNENGIGMQVTHGCMRMYAPDIERLFEKVPVGTPVRIINQPFKVGWRDGTLYVEVHQLLDSKKASSTALHQLVQQQLKQYMDYPVNWQAVEQARIEATGIPVAVGGPKMTAADNSADTSAAQQ